MQAIVQHRYGAPDVLALEEIEVPRPIDDQVLVRVHAAALFAGDSFIMRGRPLMVRLTTGLRRPRNPIPGIDVAGVVEHVGPGVSRSRPGDQVFGWSSGTFADYVCDTEEHFEAMPAHLTFEQAAAVPEAAMTALQGLRDAGRVQPGQSVLVIGASGGVGTFAVQIARALGAATVTGVCSTRNVELVRSIGADAVIDYTAGDITTGDERYDVILQVAGTESPMRLRRLLAPGGTLVLSSGMGRLNGVDRIVTALIASPLVRQRMTTFVTKENHADLVTLRELIESGSVRPIIDRTYPLGQARDAFRHLESGHTQGKIVLTA